MAARWDLKAKWGWPEGVLLWQQFFFFTSSREQD